MLRIKLLGAIGQPAQVLSAATVIIEDQFENPLAVAQQSSDDSIVLLTINDGDQFHRALKTLGLDKVVVVRQLKTSAPGAGEVPLDPAYLQGLLHDSK